MPQALHSYIVDDDGIIRLRLTSFGKDEEECVERLEEYESGCTTDYSNKTIDIYEDIAELPDRAALEAVSAAQDDGEEDEDEEEEEVEA